MSRSYKKTPVCKEGSSRGKKKGGISMKRFANSKVRKYHNEEEIPTRIRAWYKRIFCSYDICDYRFYTPIEEYLENWFKDQEHYERIYGNLDNFLQKCWYKYYKRK